MGVYTNQGSWFSRRGAFILIVAAFQLILIVGLKSGFTMKMKAAIINIIQAEVINEVVDEVEPPPPPPPQMDRPPPVEIPPPSVEINLPVSTGPTTALSNTTTETVRTPPPPPPPQPPPPQPKLTLARANQPSVNDYYPPTSQRLGEEGVVRVKLCVGTNGRVSSAEVEGTSGFPRLDEAGVKVAKLYRFQPVSQEVCNTLPVRFQLKE
jgi:protein TonB